MLSLFNKDDGTFLAMTARYVWELLITSDIVIEEKEYAYTDNEFSQIEQIAKDQGKILFDELVQKEAKTINTHDLPEIVPIIIVRVEGNPID